MKNKIILFVTTFGILCVSSSFSMQKQQDQGYWQRMKNYVAQSRVGKWFAELERLDPEGVKRNKRILSAGITGGKIGATLGMAYPMTKALMHPDAPEGEVKIALMFVGLGAALYSSINDIWNFYWQKGVLSEGELIEGIKNNVKEQLLANCPTKKTRLKMLAQQDYVVEMLKKNASSSQQEKLKASIIDKGLKQLTSELNALPESDKDRAIDKKIEMLEESVTGATQEKINKLDTDLFETTKYLLYKLNFELIAEQIKSVAEKK